MLTIILVVFIILLISVVAWGSSSINSNMFLKAVCSKKTEEKIVFLTFDDGPHSAQTPEILKVLKDEDIKASFFLIGSKVKENKKLVEEIVHDGHIIGCHSFAHSSTNPFRSVKLQESDIAQCLEIIRYITNVKTKIYRPPFGVTNPSLAKAVKNLSLTVVGWSIRSLDTLSPAMAVPRVLKKLHPGAVILLHDTTPGIADITKKIITESKQRGYRFASLDSLSGAQIYE